MDVEVKPRLSVDNLGPAQEKVTFVDDESAFQSSLKEERMAFDKLHEGDSPRFGSETSFFDFLRAFTRFLRSLTRFGMTQ